ncbi:MAG TPA: phosphoglycerate kinase [Candidatus Paceibacterota bacterium]
MPQTFKKLADVAAKDLRGKRVLLRLDLNVPIVGEEVRDDFRIKRSLPTLQFLREAGAKTIVISHLESDTTDSLSLIAEYIGKKMPIQGFVSDYSKAPAAISSMKDGDIIILENLRRDAGEKANDAAFAARLASFGDIYVNDAFAVSHRAHASIVGVTKLLPSYAGLLLATEIEELSKAFNPEHPFVFLLGGAKFDTKLPLIEKFLGIADSVFVGGALANDIFKEKGYEVGASLVSKVPVDLKSIAANPKLIVASDVAVMGAKGKAIKAANAALPGERILDTGPQTIAQLAVLLKEAKFVLWNGPVGDYEKDGFAQGTEDLARAVVASGAQTVLGGGDSIAVIANIGLLDKFSFVSTGGGAMLEFLAKGTLPGIEALKA